MDLIDQLQALASRISRQLSHITTEEATKNALVMPFLNALGYNVFDPTEVVPEYTADHGIKKGEKVDYAVMKDGRPIMLVECKLQRDGLSSAHASQLYRYFSVTEARIGVLTNGTLYQFYSDLDEPNKMDDKPFLEFDLLDMNGSLVPELKKLTNSNFDQETIIESAGELKYSKEIRRVLAEQLSSPNEEFVRFFVGRVYAGRFTKSVREQFEVITRRAFRQFLNEQVNERLKSALEREDSPDGEEKATAAEDAGEAADSSVDDDGIETTEEEVEGFLIVRGILREVVEAERVVMRDVRSYCGILLDDNNRQPLARLHFNTSQKYVGLFDNPDKREERVSIDSLDDLYSLGDRLKKTVEFYSD